MSLTFALVLAIQVPGGGPFAIPDDPITKSSMVDAALNELKPYAICIGKTARELAVGTDSATEVAVAAKGRCAPLGRLGIERGVYIVHILNQKAPPLERMPLDLVRNELTDTVDSAATNWAISEVVELRAKRAKARPSK